MFRVFDKMPFEYVMGISLDYGENTCDWQSTCYQTVPRFHIWSKDMFLNSICLCLMDNLDESGTALVSAVFVTSEPVDSPKGF